MPDRPAHAAPPPADRPMFLSCGEALWDLFAAERDGGLSFDARIGGSPFNVAVGLARLGVASGILAGVSTDRLGARLMRALLEEGVDARFVRSKDAPTTLSLVDVGPDGAPAYAFYGAGGADRAIEPDDLPPADAPIWGVHAGSYSLTAEPIGSSLLRLFERERGRRLLCLDPNVRLGVIPDPALWRARIEAFAALADLVKISAEDIGLLWPGVEPAELAARWRAAGAALVVVTHGAEGAEAFGPAGRTRAPARRVRAVDAVGAGDTFQAALIAGLDAAGARSRAALSALGGEDIARIMNFAAAAAALTCARRGADLPRRAEVEAFAREAV
ncbi:carbohydrate kinase family protein [Oceanicella actignis]|uniref:Fructokinase n=1 Tax=Oceanicella actignis TaxID=1189325 RepID=A0A1M7TCP4_9RHOB|nr:carbohydrate kinase [Oceanicella actignis]SET55373.1 fructokinase [Oceanicella actignis]SHN68428.1 fructokinase [Oceanicella actignis]